MKTGYEKTIEKYGLSAPDISDYKTLKVTDKTRWIDRDGYQYFLSRGNLQSTNLKHGAPARFFNGNIYTESNVRLYANNISDGDISVVEFHANTAHDKIIFYTSKYGYEYRKSFNEFTHNQYLIKQNYDYVNANRYSLEDIKSMALVRFNIAVVSNEYTNNETPIEFVCNCKGHGKITQSMPWTQMISGKRPCKFCSKLKYRENIEQHNKNRFEENLATVNTKHPDIEVLGTYSSAKSKIKCKCKSCGRIIFLRPDHILRGIGCGKCTKSLGEKLVEDRLLKLGIPFESQYIFPDCKMNKRAMPFDFYLPTIRTAIEFDGQQHFVPADAFGGIEGFQKMQERDVFKTKYCEDNGIVLIRIPFTQINHISNVLDSTILLQCS